MHPAASAASVEFVGRGRRRWEDRRQGCGKHHRRQVDAGARAQEVPTHGYELQLTAFQAMSVQETLSQETLSQDTLSHDTVGNVVKPRTCMYMTFR